MQHFYDVTVYNITKICKPSVVYGFYCTARAKEQAVAILMANMAILMAIIVREHLKKPITEHGCGLLKVIH